MTYAIIIIILLFNIISNIVALKFYNNTIYFQEFYEKHWILRIPYLTWYWLEALVRFKQLQNLLFILLTAIISLGFIGIGYVLIDYPTIFTILWAVILILASLFVSFIIYDIVYNAVTKLKKKNKNKR